MRVQELFEAQIINEAKLKGVVDIINSPLFSDLETTIFYTLLVDEPGFAYDADGFTDEQLDISTLIPTQEHIDGYRSSNDEPYLVVERAGKVFIIDGHHRYARDRKKGIKQIEARVLHLPDAPIDDIKEFERLFNYPLIVSGNGQIVRMGRK